MVRKLLSRTLVVVVAALVATPQLAAAQRVEVGGHGAAMRSSEFDATDAGLGARLSWLAGRWLGGEAEITVYPDDFPDDPGFSQVRWEGLFGVTAGPAIGRLRPFAKLRPGFVRFREASEPLACIAIFPPPLPCTLSEGRTLFALDIGGGLGVLLSPRAGIRVDVGDRLVKYPGPSAGPSGQPREGFYDHDFRFTVGAGLRF